MAKFAICSRELAPLVLERSSYLENNRINFEYSLRDIDLISFSKKNNESNLFYTSGNDFILVIGTPFLIGQDSFEGFLEDFQEQAIGDLVDIIGGHYVAIIKKGQCIFIIGDGLGTLDVYYNGSNPILISNDCTIASLSQELTSDLEICEIDSVFLSSGSKTVSAGVKKLINGIEYIKIDETTNFQVRKHSNTIAQRLKKYSLINNEEYYSHVDEVFKKIKDQYPCVGLNFTGGLDGRTILACLIDGSFDVELYHGRGNSQTTNTQQKDFEISKKISNELSIPFFEMNWETKIEDFSDNEIRKKFELIGDLARVHGGSTAFLHSLRQRNEAKRNIVFMGGFCPGFSNKDFHQRSYRNFKEIVQDCLKGPLSSVAYRNPKRLFDRFINESRSYCLAHELINSRDELLFEPHIIRAFLYVRPESEHLQLFNLFDCYLAPFNTNELLVPMLSMKVQYRRNRKLQLELINRNKSELLKFDLFSGIKERKITQDLEMIPLEEKKSGFQIPIRFLAYHYYMFRNPTPKKYQGFELMIYSKTIEKLKEVSRKRWFGFNLFNLRYCVRLYFFYSISRYQKALNKILIN